MLSPLRRLRLAAGEQALWPLTLRLYSRHLERDVTLTALKPPGYRRNPLRTYPLLLVNDGQDFPALQLAQRLARAYHARGVRPRVVVGIHADERRVREYGTSGQPDSAGLGDLAGAHRRFVVEELIPMLDYHFRLRSGREHRAIAGFSLGGLAAFDTAWFHDGLFASVGCFSASFWWRSAPFDPANPDADRIVIDRIHAAPRLPRLNFWFQVGTDEETADRNGNGIIDAIDDTLDVISALRERGFPVARVHYELVGGGTHDQRSWGPAFVEFMRWLDRQ